MSELIFNLDEIYPHTFKSEGHYFKGEFCFFIETEPQKLFDILSNTSLVNKHLGFNPRFEKEEDGKLVISTKFLGMNQVWIEHPWRWSSKKFILCEREHLEGPFISEYALIHIEPQGSGYQVFFHYEADLKSKWLQVLLKLTYGNFGKNYERVVKKLCSEVNLTTSNEISDRQNYVVNDFIKSGIKKNIAKKMGELIYQSDDDEVFKIQLPRLAKIWDLNEDELIGPFLIAAKKEYFEICWDIVCPHCRGAKVRARMLRDLLFENECKPCELTFQLDSIEYIDVTFTIHPKVREVREISFCAAEPFKKQHIYFQDRVKAGEKKVIQHDIESGPYRCRALGQENECLLRVGQSHNEERIQWNTSDQLIEEDIGSSITLEVSNNTNQDKMIVFEKITPPTYYLSPMKIFNNQLFRNQYTNEAIAAGVQLKLPSQIVLFTDVVDSTKFYKRVGDIEAFKQIKKHFKHIESQLDLYHGVQIKTIGDAVMATFPTVQDVFLASKKMCELIEADPDIHFSIRLSVHKGSMIAVNYNSGVDYFGDNVNIGAKLQAISEKNEISFSKEIYSTFKELFPHISTKEKVFFGEEVGYVITTEDI